MSLPSGQLLNPTRILFDLQQANEIAQSFSGCLEPETIARCITTGIVERFRFAFARIWLLEPDQAMLRLVASSGMYTRTDGFFSRVPLGAYKVGKIAQNRISFLSNNLAAEPWVGNRDWAEDNQIRGFAGYPLTIENRVVGVLAMFSRHVLEPEFLEVLQTLCTIATTALDTAIRYQQEKQTWQTAAQPLGSARVLSDQLAEILTATRLTLVGTEQPLSSSSNYLFLKTAEILQQLRCTYGRLIYSETGTRLEAIVPSLPASPVHAAHLVEAYLGEMRWLALGCGGSLEAQPTADQRAIQIMLSLSRPVDSPTPNQQILRLQIRCASPLFQLAWTQLAQAARLTVCQAPDAPLLTDDLSLGLESQSILWVQQPRTANRNHCPAPMASQIRAKLDWSIQPEHLRQALEAVLRGETWGLSATSPLLSDRELEILALLVQGHRDRDIAQALVISESTVKFHLNNTLTKLGAKTRYQAVYQAIEQGWI